MRPDGDVVARRQVVAHEILEDHAHRAAQRVQVIVAQVAAIEQDAAFVGVVEPGQQLDERGLARAVLAHQRQRFARLQGEAQVPHRPALGARIAEADILEDEALPDRHGHGRGVGGRQDFRRAPRRSRTGRRDRAPARRSRKSWPAALRAACAGARNDPARKVRSPMVSVPGQRAADDPGIGEVIADGADRR